MNKLILAVVASSLVCVAPAFAATAQKAPAVQVARHHHHHKGETAQVAMHTEAKAKPAATKPAHAMKSSHKAGVKAKAK